MLPIIRILSVGGVLLAIAILILALIPPGGTQLVAAKHEVAARGALMDSGHHPEWRQFLIQAALRRAGELERLRSLQDTVIRAPEPEAFTAEKPDRALEEALENSFPITVAPVFAGLTAAIMDAGPEDVTGSIADGPDSTIPIEIGATSSTELPVTADEDVPRGIRLPALQIPPTETPPLPTVRPPASDETLNKPATARRAVQRQRRKAVSPAAAATPAPVPPPFNILVALFESLSASKETRPPSAKASRTVAPPPVNRQALATPAFAQ